MENELNLENQESAAELKAKLDSVKAEKAKKCEEAIAAALKEFDSQIVVVQLYQNGQPGPMELKVVPV